MPVNFDAAIPFFGEWVAAIGPEHPKEKIKEICVWVYQPAPDGSGDVAATEMTTHEPGPGQHPHFLRVDGATPKDPGRWLLPVKKIGKPESQFTNGRASAIAIALVVEEVGGVKKQRVAWWNQQVELQQNEELVTAANEAVHAAANPEAKAEEVLKGEGKLAEPLTFKGD
jgi:hypothetical protein